MGGTCLQITRDLMGFNVLMTASKGLTPSQQAWPPLTLEGYAQLETKRAQKKFLGSMRSLCWTDLANWTRQLVLEDVDVKHLRWVSFLVSDGSQIRSLSGRSAKLGDGYSRNPKERDALVEQRTKDLEGRMGQLRGFSLDAFLADDAIPDKVEEADAAAQMVAELAASAGVLPVLRAALVMDYYDIETGRRPCGRSSRVAGSRSIRSRGRSRTTLGPRRSSRLRPICRGRRSCWLSGGISLRQLRTRVARSPFGART